MNRYANSGGQSHSMDDYNKQGRSVKPNGRIGVMIQIHGLRGSMGTLDDYALNL